jgi:tetratricopeptide (TPR) repeat protein
LILEKTEGVPFFIEELIKSLQDLNVVERIDEKCILSKDIGELTIPSTIHDVIMARVDNLPEGAKEVLQIGSVIEREFEYELIKRVAGLPQDQLLSYLSVLKDSELLYERGVFPDSAYIFKHALTREVVYDSILTKKKKRIHDEIGKAIEELHKSDKQGFCEILSHHYGKSDNYILAAEYSSLAAQKASRAGSPDDAIDYTRKRVTSLEMFAQTEEVQREVVNARAALGRYLTQKDLFIEAKNAVDPILDLAVKMGNTRSLSLIYSIMGLYYSMSIEDYSQAINYFDKALKVSEDIKDPSSQFYADFWISLPMGVLCNFDKAFHHIDRVIKRNEDTENIWMIAHSNSFKGFWYFYSGQVEKGYQTTLRAVRSSEKSGDIHSKAVVYGRHGLLCYGKGFFSEAVEYLSKGSDFCEKLHFYSQNSLGKWCLGEISFELGEYDKADDYFQQSILDLEKSNLPPSGALLYKLSKACAMVMNNEKDIDLEMLYNYATINKQKNLEGSIANRIGIILLNIDNQHISEAEEWIQKAMEADNRNGMMWHLGRDYALYAELFKRKGDQSKAKENLNKAIEILKECGADGWVEKYEKELAELS